MSDEAHRDRVHEVLDRGIGGRALWTLAPAWRTLLTAGSTRRLSSSLGVCGMRFSWLGVCLVATGVIGAIGGVALGTGEALAGKSLDLGPNQVGAPASAPADACATGGPVFEIAGAGCPVG